MQQNELLSHPLYLMSYYTLPMVSLVSWIDWNTEGTNENLMDRYMDQSQCMGTVISLLEDWKS